MGSGHPETHEKTPEHLDGFGSSLRPAGARTQAQPEHAAAAFLNSGTDLDSPIPVSVESNPFVVVADWQQKTSTSSCLPLNGSNPRTIITGRRERLVRPLRRHGTGQRQQDPGASPAGHEHAVDADEMTRNVLRHL